jgi:heme exporter protein C
VSAPTVTPERPRIDTPTAVTALACVLMAVALWLVFFWVPNDAIDGFRQRLFYLHVPIAMTTYLLFVWGAINAARLLWTGDLSLDLKSYVPMHLGTVFGTLTLITGSIWAHTSWGVWWYWGSEELNSFLIIFLFYCAYFMLRFSIEPGERRARYSAVYALLGVGLIPVSVVAVHMVQNEFHPIVFTDHGAQMANSMLFTFLVAFAAVFTLAVSMYLVELRGKRLDERLADLRRRAAGRA